MDRSIAGKESIAHDLSAVVYVQRLAVRSSQRAQVHHRGPAIEESVVSAAAGLGVADDLSAVVNALSVTVDPAERAKVGHPGPAVEESMPVQSRVGVRTANDLPFVIDAPCLTYLSPKCAHVGQGVDCGIFMLAFVAAVLSHVPGGNGVFDVLIVEFLPKDWGRQWWRHCWCSG